MKSLKYGVLALAIALAACSKPGAQFEGKWQNVKKPQEVFEISRNGENFIMELNNKKIPATLNGETLTVKNVFSFDFAHIKATDTLAGAGEEFKRVE